MTTENYVKTPTEIHDMARGFYAAQDTVMEGRQTYLRALVATVQANLAETKAEPLAALESVNARFYEAVVKAAQEATPPRIPDRALVVNRKTGFARSSASVLRSWLKAGGDLSKLKPAKVTKAALAVPHKARAPSASRLKARVEARSKALVTSLLELGEQSHSIAAEELELLMTQLTDQLGAITGAAPKAVKRFQAAKTQVLSRAEVARAVAP